MNIKTPTFQRALLFGLCLAAVAIFVLDLFFPRGVAIYLLYYGVIVCGILLQRPATLYSVALLCTTLTWLGYLGSEDIGISKWITVGNRLMASSVLWTVTALGLRVRHLTRQIAEIGRFLTLCGWSHKVKLGERWVTIEEFLTGEFNYVISHGLSPELLEQFRREALSPPLPSEPKA